MDPSTRGPFIRGVLVATILAIVIFGGAGFKRAGLSFEYDIESETKLPDGEELRARWSGNAEESRNSRRYETSDEEAPPLTIFGGREVRHTTRHVDMSEGHRADAIEGYKTLRYQVTETDTIWFEGTDRPAIARIVTDYWMAPELRGAAGPVLTFADSVMHSRVGIHKQRRSGRHSAREHHFPGTPLRIVSRAVLVDPHGQRYESETTSELSSIERGPRFDFSFDF